MSTIANLKDGEAISINVNSCNFTDKFYARRNGHMLTLEFDSVYGALKSVDVMSYAFGVLCPDLTMDGVPGFENYPGSPWMTFKCYINEWSGNKSHNPLDNPHHGSNFKDYYLNNADWGESWASTINRPPTRCNCEMQILLSVGCKCGGV